MVGVVEGVGFDVFAEAGAVGGELLVGEGVGSGGEDAGVGVGGSAFAEAVLHAEDLHAVPVVEEGAEDATVIGHVAVPVGGAFPGADGGEVGGWREATCHWLMA